mgnify:CR=1 FL=1
MSVSKRTPIVSKTMFSIVPARTMRLKLAPSDYQVLIALGSMSNRYGVCFPSAGKLSAFTGVAEAQVRKSIVKLVRQRLVRRLKSKHVHGVKRLGRYQVLCLAPDQPMPTKEEVWEPVGYQRRQLWAEETQIDEGSGENIGEERQVKAAASQWVRAIEGARGAVMEAEDQHRHVRSAMIDRGMTEYEIMSRTEAWLSANPGRIPASAEVTLKAIA